MADAWQSWRMTQCGLLIWIQQGLTCIDLAQLL
jgi:hypothetical protein